MNGIRMFIALLVLCMSGCGYHAVGSNRGVIEYGRTVWVDFIGNTSSSSTAQTILRRELLAGLQAQRGLIPSADRADAGLTVSGTLKNYAIQPVSYTAQDQVREYRLTIEVELEARQHTSAKPLWKGVVRSFQDFPAADPRNPLLGLQKNAEESALAAASRKLAHSLIASMEESY